MSKKHIAWGEDKPLTIVDAQSGSKGLFVATLHEPKAEKDSASRPQWFANAKKLWAMNGKDESANERNDVIRGVYRTVKPYGRKHVGNGEVVVGTASEGPFVLTPMLRALDGSLDFGLYRVGNRKQLVKASPSEVFGVADIISLANRASSHETLERVPFVPYVGAPDTGGLAPEIAGNVPGADLAMELLGRASEIRARVRSVNATLSDEAAFNDLEAATERTKAIEALNRETTALNADLAEQRLGASLAGSVLTTMRLLHQDPKQWPECTPLTDKGVLGPCVIGHGDDAVRIGEVTPQMATKALGHLHIPLTAIPDQLREFDAAVGEMIHHAIFNAHAARSTTYGAEGFVYDTAMAKRPMTTAVEIERLATRTDELSKPFPILVNRLREIVRACEGKAGLRSLLLDLTGKRGSPEFHLGEDYTTRKAMDERISGGAKTMDEIDAPENWDKQIPKLLRLLEQDAPTLHAVVYAAMQSAGIDIRVLETGRDFDVRGNLRDVGERLDGVSLGEFALEESIPLHLQPKRPSVQAFIEAINDLACARVAETLERKAARGLEILEAANKTEANATREFDERIAYLRAREARVVKEAPHEIPEINLERGAIRRAKEADMAAASELRASVDIASINNTLDNAESARSLIRGKAHPEAIFREFTRCPEDMRKDVAQTIKVMTREIVYSVRDIDIPEIQDSIDTKVGAPPKLTNRPKTQKAAIDLARIVVNKIKTWEDEGKPIPGWTLNMGTQFRKVGTDDLQKQVEKWISWEGGIEDGSRSDEIRSGRGEHVRKIRDEVVGMVRAARQGDDAGKIAGIIDDNTTTHGLEQALRDVACVIPSIPVIYGNLTSTPVVDPSTAVALDLLKRQGDDLESRFDDPRLDLNPRLQYQIIKAVADVLGDRERQITNEAKLDNGQPVVKEEMEATTVRKLIEDYKSSQIRQNAKETKAVTFAR